MFSSTQCGILRARIPFPRSQYERRIRSFRVEPPTTLADRRSGGRWRVGRRAAAARAGCRTAEAEWLFAFQTQPGGLLVQSRAAEVVDPGPTRGCQVHAGEVHRLLRRSEP